LVLVSRFADVLLYRCCAHLSKRVAAALRERALDPSIDFVVAAQAGVTSSRA
jgi:hypothetical protein